VVNEQDRTTSAKGPGGDEAVERTVGEDAILAFFVRWRRWFFGAALIIIIGYYVQHTSRQAYNQALGEASDVFASAQEEFSDWRAAEARPEATPKADDAKDDEKPDVKDPREALAPVENKLESLQEQKFVYADIARGYELLLKVEEGNLDEARKVLAGMPNEASRSEDDKKFFADLTALLAARSLLDDPNARDEAVAKLRVLAQGGGYVSIPAAMSIARLADTPEERGAALELLQGLREKTPVNAAVLDEEIKKLRS